MIRFLYFDLGNVLLSFDHEVACRQMAQLAGIEPGLVRQVIFTSGLQWRREQGQVTREEFLTAFAQETGASADPVELCRAAGAIFTPIYSSLVIAAHLQAAGYRLGILSNTCDIHWEYVADGRYRVIPSAFETIALSFEIGAAKPDPRVYERAAELARTPPEEIFFVDDRPENVAGAKSAGFDAVTYTGAADLVLALRARDIRVNW